MSEDGDKTEKRGFIRRLFGGGGAHPALETAPEQETAPLATFPEPSAADVSLEPEPQPAPAVLSEPEPLPAAEALPESEPSPSLIRRLFGGDAAHPASETVAEPEAPLVAVEALPAIEAPPEPAPAPKRTWFQRLRSGLSLSSNTIGRGIAEVFTKRKLDADSLDDLEDILIQADLGLAGRHPHPRGDRARALREGNRPDAVRAVLADEVERALAPVARPLVIDPSKRPFVILVVGVNGSGKTTTIGKLAANSAAKARRSCWRLATRSAPRRSSRRASGRAAPGRISSSASRAPTRRVSPLTPSPAPASSTPTSC